MNLQVENIAEEGDDPTNELRVELTEDDVEALKHGDGFTIEFPEALDATLLHGIYVTNPDVPLDVDWVKEQMGKEQQRSSFIHRLLGSWL